MAEMKTMRQQLGLTPGKAILIGALAVALLGILYRQYGSSGGGEAASAAAERSRRRAAPQPRPAAPTAVTDAQPDNAWQVERAEFDQTKWQSPPLSEVIAYDPFALPAEFPQPPRALLDPALAAQGGEGSQAARSAQQLADAVEQAQRQLAELQQRGVHVILNQNVAMIGDRTLHVGDEINGFIVTAIEPDGVRVERKGLE